MAGHGVVTLPLPGLGSRSGRSADLPKEMSQQENQGMGREQSAVLHFVCQDLGIQGRGCAFQGGAGICSLGGGGIPKLIPSLFWTRTTGTQHWGLSEASSLALFGAEIENMQAHPLAEQD